MSAESALLTGDATARAVMAGCGLGIAETLRAKTRADVERRRRDIVDSLDSLPPADRNLRLQRERRNQRKGF